MLYQVAYPLHGAVHKKGAYSMKFTLESLPFLIRFPFLLLWSQLSMSLSKNAINLICRIIVTIDICLFLLTLKYFRIWLLFFYIAVGAFFLREKFGRWTTAAYERRNSVSSMQDCIVCVGTLMLLISLTLLPRIRH